LKLPVTILQKIPNAARYFEKVYEDADYYLKFCISALQIYCFAEDSNLWYYQGVIDNPIRF
jgi:hypothetical protein